MKIRDQNKEKLLELLRSTDEAKVAQAMDIAETVMDQEIAIIFADYWTLCEWALEYELNNVAEREDELLPEYIAKFNQTELRFVGIYATYVPQAIGLLQQAESLNLHYNGFNTFPMEILQLQNLRELDLSENSLKQIPPEICQLKNLETLKLDYNQLTTLPPEIGLLPNLKHLILSNNELTSIPTEIGLLQALQNLNLYDNQLKTIPSEIGKLSNLKKLELWENELIDLPDEIGNLSSLQDLFLGNNYGIKQLRKDVFQKLQNLKTLDIGGSGIAHQTPELKSWLPGCFVDNGM